MPLPQAIRINVRHGVRMMPTHLTPRSQNRKIHAHVIVAICGGNEVFQTLACCSKKEAPVGISGNAIS